MTDCSPCLDIHLPWTAVRWPLRGKQRPYPLQVFRGVHTGWRSFDSIGDMNFFTVPQGTQLLQTFGLLQPARPPLDKTLQKTGPINIDTDMTAERYASRQLVRLGDKGIPRPGQR